MNRCFLQVARSIGCNGPSIVLTSDTNNECRGGKGPVMFKSSNLNDNGQAMFILEYLTLFAILYHQTLGELDCEWGIFLTVSQGNENHFPTYDIGDWTRHPNSHLQHCPFVENGEEFYPLSVELQTVSSATKIVERVGVSTFVLGLCECFTVRSWVLCSVEQMQRWKSDCIFTETIPPANTSTKVHKKLCDVALLTEYAEPYNCSVQMANQRLYRTEESICSPRGVCGITQCCAANQMVKRIERYQKSYRRDDSYQNTSGERMLHHSNSEYRDPSISLRRRLMFLSYDYLEDRDRSFGRGAEFAGSDSVAVNEDVDDDDDEDEDDEPYDDPEEETENEEDGDVWDDDGELAENDEDDASNTDSSELDEYVRRARDPNTKKTGLRWANERLSRFARSNPSGSPSYRKRQDEQESGGSSEEECDEPEDGSGMDGPLQYVEYDAAEAHVDQQGKGMGNADEDDMSMAGVGQFSKPYILYHLSIYIGIALCI